MKLRKIKPLSVPVPTDNPKPTIRKVVARVRQRPKTEPAPQPVVGGGRKAVKSLRVVEPRPQPVVPKGNGASVKRKVSRKKRETGEENQRLVTSSPTNETNETMPAAIVQSSAAHEEVAVSPRLQIKEEEPSQTLVSTKRAVRQPRPLPVAIPSILLEPDHVPGDEPVLTGPGARFLATPSLEPTPVAVSPTELPESYGTQQIFMAARDPYWLLASWDLDDGQRRRYNGQSASGALAVRLRKSDAEGPIHLEVHVKADSRDWFIYAGLPDTTFVAELGFHEKNSGVWRRISVSKPATMPRDRVVAAPVLAHVEAPRIAEERRFDPEPFVEPAPLPEPPPAVRFKEALFAVMQSIPHWPATQPAFEQPWEEPRYERVEMPATPVLKSSPAPAWTEKQAKALDELISLEARRWQHGSMEIEELLRRHIGRPEEETALSSLEMVHLEEMQAKPEAPSSLELAQAPVRRKGFWFKVNAELIIYGSTEPDAHVMIGGRTIRLREDGTFSYRFALPDGEYGLPVLAIAHDYSEARGADLRFARATQYLGEVGAHAQDSNLKTPSPANV